MTPGLVIVAQAGRVCSAIRYCLDSIKTILFSHKLKILLDNILCSQRLSMNILFSLRLPILETGSGLVTAYLQASLCDLQEYLIFRNISIFLIFLLRPWCMNIGYLRTSQIFQTFFCRVWCINICYLGTSQYSKYSIRVSDAWILYI